MKRDTVTTALQVVANARQSIEELRAIVDGEALRVSDRHLIDQAISTIAGEMEALTQTLGQMLEDPTKSE